MNSTEPNVGPSSQPQRIWRSSTTSRSLANWYAAIHALGENSVPSSPRSKRKGSSGKRTVPTAPSRLEETFALQLKAHRISPPTLEFRFHSTRKWRFDFAWTDQKVAVEIEGGTWTGGRHTSGAGFAADAEKYAEAQLAGWIVFRVTEKHLRNGMAIEWTKRALGE